MPLRAQVDCDPNPSRGSGLRAGATKSLVLGFARVDGQLDVGRAPIRALAKATAKVRRAFAKAAGKAAQQGGGYCLISPVNSYTTQAMYFYAHLVA